MSAMPHTWPLQLGEHPLRLRSLRRRDRRALDALRERNRDWLAPWNASDPQDAPGPFDDVGAQDATAPTSAREIGFHRLRRIAQEQGRSGWALHLAIEHEGQLVGQVAASPILYGAYSTATLGYWVDEARAGRGIAPHAAALMIDHCFTELGIHRIEANVRPENEASIRVMQKLHFRCEGLRERLIHVHGAFRDHLCYALTADELPFDASGRPARTRLHGEHPLR